MNAALTGTDPVIFFESQRIYDEPEQFVKGGVPAGLLRGPLRRAGRQEGRQGPDHPDHRRHALPRARGGQDSSRRSTASPARSSTPARIVPFNYEKVIESVKKTRKILLASRRLRARQRPADDGRQDHASSPSTNWTPRRSSSARATGSPRPTKWKTPSSRIAVRHPRRRPRAHPAAQGLHRHPRLLQCRPAAPQRRRGLAARQ